MKPVLIVTVGLPRSGKSTWTRKQPFPVVSPDAVRLTLHGQRFWAGAEKMVWALVPMVVRVLFASGNPTVVLDATNVTRWERDQWQSDEWVTVFHHVDTPPAECCKRAIATGQEDLVEVIANMAAKFEPLGDDEKRLWVK